MMNMLGKLLLSASMVFACVSTTVAQGGRPTVVGYYPDWGKGVYPASVIAFENLTHVVHAFLIPNSDGSFADATGFAYPDLVLRAHQAGVKVVVSFGGWGQSDGFSPMVADSASRHRFVQNVLVFCQANNYDGVDLDWEYPASTMDRTNLALLVHELRQAFTGYSFSISLAVPAGDWTGKWFDFAGMKNDIDWLGIMTYDYYGSWTTTSGPNSPLYGKWSTNTQGWIDDSYKYYNATRAVPAAKLLIGIPFYGWKFSSSTMYGASTGASQQPYASIAPHLAQGWTRYWDSDGQVPYMINASATEVISYDDTSSLRIKCAYIVAKGIQGAIIWAIGQDLMAGAQPLLARLGSDLGLTSAAPDQDAMVRPTSALLQNYPNPFNPNTTIRYSLSHRSDVQLTVFNTLGQPVATLVNGEKEAGYHEVTFNGSGLASGVYFCRLRAGSADQTRMLLLLK